MSAPNPDRPESPVTDEDKYLFDLQGYLLLEGAIAEDDRALLLDEINRLEQMEFDQSHFRPSPNGKTPQPIVEKSGDTQVRLNGILRISDVFDRLIDYPAVLPYLREFMVGPQLGNAWTISKTKGNPAGGWHRGLQPDQYTVRHGKINTRMLNTIYFLTDNGPKDGTVGAIPGGHKSNFDIQFGQYKGLELPGSIPVQGKAGDILIFSEALLHTGLPKTTDGKRTNIYLNYVSKDFSIMMYSPEHNRNFAMPPSVRERWTEQQRAMTEWMAYANWEESSYLQTT